LFAVRREVLDALLEDPEWSKRLDNAENARQVENVLVEFAKSRGYRIKEI